MKHKPLVIDYFSDMLCIWAYAAQKRSDEIQKHFGDQVQIRQHFISIFGAVEQKMLSGWGDEGVKGYHRHVLKAVKAFDYLEVHPEVWLGDYPQSSLNIHIFMKAVQALVEQGDINMDQFEDFLWQCRLAFFKQGKNIGRTTVLCEIAKAVSIDQHAVLEKIDSGVAHAALEKDRLLAEEYQVTGSPTYLLNEGRQRLYGNVGYRIIEANLQELLAGRHQQDASWC